MKRISPTPWSSRLLRPLPVGLGSPFTTSPYKGHFADDDLSILSYSREINETDVNYTCNLQKVWDSSDSLNGNSCSLFIFIRSTIPVISGDFLTRWNAITVGKGRGKGQFLGISYFWIDVLGLNYLTKEPPSFPTFQVKARLYVNFIAELKYSFLDSFCFVLWTKSLL